MMRPILRHMDDIGFDALEIMGAVHFDACVRYLREDPWERLRLMRDTIRKTPRQAIIRSKCALRFELEPDDIMQLFVERLVANGISRLIAFDGLHDLDNILGSLAHAKSLGAHTGGWLIFSVSPVHTDDFYAAKAREFLDRAGVDELVIEDTSGILTPERVATLVPTLKRTIGNVPLALHVHNLVGLAQRTCIEAVRHGVDTLYTCIAPIADGNAPPSVQTTMRNIGHAGHEVALHGETIAVVSAYLTRLAEIEDKPLGTPNDFDAANFDHQIPGGVLSNLAAQLDAAGLGDRLGAVLEECGRVREELGWPIMVTPFSQFVGVQATLNVISGDRYGRVPDELKKFALGYFGKLNAPINGDILDRIVERGSRTIAPKAPTPEPALPGLRARYPGAGDEELLLRHSFPQMDVDAMYAAEPDDDAYSIAGRPFVNLLRDLMARPSASYVAVERGDFRLRLKRGN